MIKCSGKDKIQCIFFNYSRLAIDNDSYPRFQSVDIKDIYVK